MRVTFIVAVNDLRSVSNLLNWKRKKKILHCNYIKLDSKAGPSLVIIFMGTGVSSVIRPSGMLRIVMHTNLILRNASPGLALNDELIRFHFWNVWKCRNWPGLWVGSIECCHWTGNIFSSCTVIICANLKEVRLGICLFITIVRSLGLTWASLQSQGHFRVWYLQKREGFSDGESWRTSLHGNFFVALSVVKCTRTGLITEVSYCPISFNSTFTFYFKPIQHFSVTVQECRY